MFLTDKQIEKFQLIYRRVFGKSISREEAIDKGIKLVHLMEIIYKPMTRREFDKVSRRRKHLTNTCEDS